MNNILSNNDFLLDEFNPPQIAKNIASNLKVRRLELNITQQELANKSGVSLGSVKRFESKYEISLKSLLSLAVVLQSTDMFLTLFTKKQYSSINEITEESKLKTRKRARKK